MSAVKQETIIEPQLSLVPSNGAAPLTPMALIEIATRQGAGIEQLERLMALQERYEKNEARKAYFAAMDEFKKNPPELEKNKHVKFNTTEFDHATLDHVTERIIAALSKVGISHSWKPTQIDGKVRVTCVLSHRAGHSEETTLEGPPDNSGSKNAIQAIAATVTYLERYTLLAATGLAVKGMDSDGHVTNGNFAEKLEWIQNAKDVPELMRLFSNAYNEASAVKDKRAMALAIEARDKRKKEIA
jgi:hypothetical protein